MTAKNLNALAQRTHRKVRVLQNKLHQAAKKEPNRTFGILYDKVCRWEVLWIAWLRVQKNKGAPGVDGRTILAIKEYGEVRFLKEIQEELRSKKYKPQPIRRVFIKKHNRKLRPLGIPIVKDRVIQGAVKLVIEPIFEANFLEGSYGFRPKRSCQDALYAVRKWVTYGYKKIIDADIASYFDTIDHEILMNLFQRRIRDKWILRLVRGWLRCAVFEQDRTMLLDKGTPQGGVISPLLANIYLHSLDKYWQRKHDGWNTKLVRYCDDFVVLIRDRDSKPYMESLKVMLDKLKLALSPEKTKVIQAEEGFNFLGVRLKLQETRKKRKFCYGFPTKKSMNQIRSNIRKEIGKDYQPSLAHKIKYLNPILRGWANYFNWLNSATHFKKIDRYVAKRLDGWNRRKYDAVGRQYHRIPEPEFYKQGLFRLGGKIARI